LYPFILIVLLPSPPPGRGPQLHPKPFTAETLNPLFLAFPQAEAKSESERVRKDGKELAEKVRELEGQLEWVRSEREEEVQQLKADKKGLEQRAREAESQLAQIKSRKKDELKVGIGVVVTGETFVLTGGSFVVTGEFVLKF
jgi:hypothetical protein